MLMVKHDVPFPALRGGFFVFYILPLSLSLAFFVCFT